MICHVLSNQSWAVFQYGSGSEAGSVSGLWCADDGSVRCQTDDGLHKPASRSDASCCSYISRVSIHIFMPVLGCAKEMRDGNTKMQIKCPKWKKVFSENTITNKFRGTLRKVTQLCIRSCNRMNRWNIQNVNRANDALSHWEPRQIYGFIKYVYCRLKGLCHEEWKGSWSLEIIIL